MFIEYQISILEWFLKDHVNTNVAVFTAFLYQINAFLEKKKKNVSNPDFLNVVYITVHYSTF